MSIDKDFEDGDKFEEFILSKVKQKNPKAYKTDGYFPDYDIWVNSRQTLECKFDRLSKETGNVAIEYEYEGHPSGINHSKATAWVLGYWNKKWKYIYIPSQALIKACQNAKKVSGGDRMASKMYLLPVQQLEQIKDSQTRVV